MADNVKEISNSVQEKIKNYQGIVNLTTPRIGICPLC